MGANLDKQLSMGANLDKQLSKGRPGVSTQIQRSTFEMQSFTVSLVWVLSRLQAYRCLRNKRPS
jgi:hypothetical protein